MSTHSVSKFITLLLQMPPHGFGLQFDAVMSSTIAAEVLRTNIRHVHGTLFTTKFQSLIAFCAFVTAQTPNSSTFSPRAGLRGEQQLCVLFDEMVLLPSNLDQQTPHVTRHLIVPLKLVANSVLLHVIHDKCKFASLRKSSSISPAAKSNLAFPLRRGKTPR